MRLGSARNNATTTTAVNTSTIFTITAVGGVTPSHSVSTEETYSPSLDITPRPSFGNNYYMQIVSDGGAIFITADPQITAGSTNDKITLEGTSDTNSVQLVNGTGLSLAGGVSFTLGLGDIICLIYTNSVWRETSRFIKI
jgi:hypothetical protein